MPANTGVCVCVFVCVCVSAVALCPAADARCVCVCLPQGGNATEWTRPHGTPDPRPLRGPQMEKPPDWHVLLLDKTFEQKKNTVAHVAACISAVVGLATVVAMRKTQHAKDNFYSVLQTTEKFSEAVRVAQALQGRGLVVRVAPGARLPPSEDGRLGRRGQRRGRRRRLQRARRAATM
ncbi:unnamed protein product [Prorocentrum cordatum]|uniref:Uncharacterized protein n=1 Tax=Prorocentrum cordatum TaxID=2364126 RepID=A0ABN9UFQ4_9DINO|nr:unnamed protein product [Polarella glacialis]